ncbi:hypothetical protein BpHYR1_008363 [Brachionus plicatilis]|uniref:Uncharacterized protein n=1 Tax=Brachionus plicatilis TaxID=10195 RepID=A0A3M7PXM1_BRAPC|nr:hypothetical protein BpHYR1_008363 [Brachionus plicatilis]
MVLCCFERHYREKSRLANVCVCVCVGYFVFVANENVRLDLKKREAFLRFYYSLAEFDCGFGDLDRFV